MRFSAKAVRYIVLFFVVTSNYIHIVSGQELTISGTIKDILGEPIPGATIIIQGTTEGTVSDMNGAFSFSIPVSTNTLLISALGYRTQEVDIGSQSVFEINMQPTNTNLQEIVSTGYVQAPRKNITSSISTIDADLMKEIPAGSFPQQLQGRAAGVMVMQDYRPGANPMVRIRGYGTINNNDPLYIVDGIPMYNDYQSVNPNNIESVQVLKDASASIYSARAGNGVILITTKNGKKKGTEFTFDARYGWQKANGKVDLLNTQQLGELMYQQDLNDFANANGGDTDGFDWDGYNSQYGGDPNASDFIPDYVYPNGAFFGEIDESLYNYSDFPITRANREGTDWFDEIYQTAPIQEYHFGATTGTDRGRYYFGLGYFDQQGVVKHTRFNRISLRANTEFSIKNWFRVGENLEVSYNENVNTDNNEENAPILGSYRMQPIFPVYDIGGYFAGIKGSSSGSGENPLAIVDRNKDNVAENWRIFGNAFLEIDFLKNLTFRSHLGLDYSTWYQSSFTALNPESAEPRASNHLLVQSDYQLNTTWYNTLNYNKVFAGKHALNVLLGMELIESRYRFLSGSRSDYFVEDLSYRFLNAGESAQQNSGTGSEWNMFSLFAKVNYSFQNKYLADFIIRRDGSSRFGSEYRYGVFPAFSLGWRISDESFLSGVKWIDDLKLRGSWGQMGNQNIDPYNQYSTFRTHIWRSSYDITGSNNSVRVGYDTERFGNPFGRWETTTVLDIGFDATVFNGRFSLYFDWFDRKTTDMLVQLPLPASQGDAATPFQNAGEMENKGVEFSFFYNNGFSNSEFQYSIGFNISHYSNKVLKLGEDQDMIIPGPSLRQVRYTRTVSGEPFMSYWGKERNGFTNGSESYWTEDNDYVSDIYPGYYNYISQYGEGVGRFKFVDQNGDGIINEEDNTYIGSPHPDFYYGLNAAFEWKGFDFTLFFQGVSGMELINYVSRWIDFVLFQGNRSVKMYEKSWTPALGDEADLPVLSFGDYGSYQSNDYFVQKASYLRMRNMMFGYTFSNIKGVDRLRLYFQMLNLFTITKYEGLEPDVATANQVNELSLGIDQGVYPSAKTFLLGLNFKF